MPGQDDVEEDWRRLPDDYPIGMAMLGTDLRVLRANAALCRMLGYECHELIGLTLADLAEPAAYPLELERITQLLGGRIPSYRIHQRLLRKDGRLVPCDLSAAVIRDAEGEPRHVVCHVSDLSDAAAGAAAEARLEVVRGELEEKTRRLEESIVDLESFAMVVSHDLQAPLTAITGYLELLETDVGESLGPQARDWVTRASAAAGRMSELLTSVLALSRADASTEREKVSVAEVLDDVRTDLDPMIRAEGAVISVPPDQPEVLADRACLRQLLQNLVQNALKYRHPDRTPCVDISVEDRLEGWLVSVEDNAVGVPEDRREAIFGLFTRLADSYVTAELGHGIGLAACRRIVARHGGRIWVEDNPAGHGSRFCFTLTR